VGFTIRLAEDRDAAAIAAIYAPYVVGSPVSFETEAPDAEEIGRRIVTLLQTHPWLVCETEAGKTIGYVYGSPHRARAAYCWACEVSVYIDSEYRRYGVARGLYASLFECLRLMGFVQAYAGITLPNAASVGLHEAIGFEPVGIYKKIGFKAGAWHDVGWWGLELQTPPENPAPPQKLPEVVGSPEWELAVNSGASLIRLP
jgi:L-amino acid N-acyltransferase YncA